MPLTKKGSKIRRAFMKEYGKRGKSIFYAYERKHHGEGLKRDLSSIHPVHSKQHKMHQHIRHGMHYHKADLTTIGRVR